MAEDITELNQGKKWTVVSGNLKAVPLPPSAERGNPLSKNEAAQAVKYRVRSVRENANATFNPPYAPEHEAKYEIGKRMSKYVYDFYKKFGIEISEINFPWTFIQGKIDDKKHWNGFYLQDGRLCFVASEDEATLGLEETVAHEIFHGIGAQAYAVWRDKENTKIHGIGSELGYITMNPKGIVRGKALEEGLAVKFTEPFWKSDSNWLTSPGPLREMYVSAYYLVNKLIEDGGEEMEKLLYVARIDPGKTRQLQDKIDGLYGKGTTKSLFDLKLEKEPIDAFLETLESRKTVAYY